MSSQDGRPWTVLAVLNWTKQYLARSGVPSARLAAEVLLAHCLGCERIELYTRFEQQPAAEKLAEFRALVKRAAGHEPVAYLVGHKEFYSLSFKVTGDVLIPRPETEALVSAAIGHLAGQVGQPGQVGQAVRPAGPAPDSSAGPHRMWDVCTGSGCVAVTVAKQVANVRVLATDICPKAIAVAKGNAAAHSVESRISFASADLLTPPPGCDVADGFDVITANPPYVADGDPVDEQVAYEPAKALMAGADGLDFIRPVIASAGGYLAVGGMLALEFAAGQADDVRDLLVATGEFAEPKIIRDHQGIERIATAVRR